MRATSRLTLSFCALVTVGGAVLSAAPAIASPPAAAITTVPSGDRYDPRAADILGANATGFVYRVEKDPGLFAPGGTQEARWHSYDGEDDHSLGNLHGAVVGNHLVGINTGVSPTIVTDQPLPSGTATQLGLPDGYSYVAATGDGLLLASQQLGLYFQPWGTASLTPVANFPGSLVQVNPVNGANTEDTHGALVQIAPQSGGQQLVYVDTRTPESWTLPPTAFQHPSLGTTKIAWLEAADNGPGVIGTVTRPQPGDLTVGAESTRTAPNQPQASSAHYDATLPFGSTVLLWHTQDFGGYTRAFDYPVEQVDSGGTSTVLTGWGHGLALTPTGDLLLVNGNAPTDSVIKQVTVGTTTLTTVVTLDPIPARVGQVAVDGSRVVTVDDSDFNGGVVNQTLTATGGVASVTDRAELASDVTQTPGQFCNDPNCSGVVAGRGITSFGRTDIDHGDHLVTYDGATKVGEVIPDHSGSLDGVDDRSVLIDSSSPTHDSVYDIASTTISPTGAVPPSLNDGKLYNASSANPGATVTVTDVATGTTSQLAAPTGCNTIGDVQASGRWLMMQCGVGTGDDIVNHWVVTDRLGTVADWNDLSTDGSDTRWLGDGFVVADDAGELSWTDLTDATHTWSDLGAWSGEAGQVAVDRTGAQATAVWVDSDAVAHAAVLPVTASVDAPEAPTAITGTPGDQQVQLQWQADGSNGSPITGYKIFPLPACAACTGTTVSSAITSTTVGGLTNGTTYRFRVAAVNAVGVSPLSPLSANFKVDPSKSATTVTIATLPTSLITDSAVTIHATVSATVNGFPTPTGSAQMSLFGKHHHFGQCTGGVKRPVNNGVVTCVVTAGQLRAADAPYTVSVAYLGGTSFKPSSASGTLSVKPAPSDIAVLVKPAKASATTKTTITALAPEAATGKVAFTIKGKNGATATCKGGSSKSLASGKATCVVKAGGLSSKHSPYKVTAKYAGDGNYLASKATEKIKISAT